MLGDVVCHGHVAAAVVVVDDDSDEDFVRRPGIATPSTESRELVMDSVAMGRFPSKPVGELFPGQKRRHLGGYRINFVSVRELDVVMYLVVAAPRVALAQSFMCLPLTQPKGGRRLFVQAKLSLAALRRELGLRQPCEKLTCTTRPSEVSQHEHACLVTPIGSAVATIMQV